MRERRVSPRWQVNKEAGLTVIGSIKPIPCRVEDISTRGMRISMRRNLFPEVFSNFSLALSDNFSLNQGKTGLPDAQSQRLLAQALYRNTLGQ